METFTYHTELTLTCTIERQQTKSHVRITLCAPCSDLKVAIPHDILHPFELEYLDYMARTHEKFRARVEVPVTVTGRMAPPEPEVGIFQWLPEMLDIKIDGTNFSLDETMVDIVSWTDLIQDATQYAMEV